MKAALISGVLAMLLLTVPSQSVALGLAEYGQEVISSEQPVLALPKLDLLRHCFSDQQVGVAIHCLLAIVPLLCVALQVLLTGLLLAGHVVSPARGYLKYAVKIRRAAGPWFHLHRKNSLSMH